MLLDPVRQDRNLSACLIHSNLDDLFVLGKRRVADSPVEPRNNTMNPGGNEVRYVGTKAIKVQILSVISLKRSNQSGENTLKHEDYF